MSTVLVLMPHSPPRYGSRLSPVAFGGVGEYCVRDRTQAVFLDQSETPAEIRRSEILVAGLAVSPLVKAALVLAGSVPILYASYHFLVRTTWVGLLLNGRRYPINSNPVNLKHRPPIAVPNQFDRLDAVAELGRQSR